MTGTFKPTIKLIIVGNSSVGKTCLMGRFASGEFSDRYNPTLGVDFKLKTLEIDDVIYRIQIWDTAGQERFQTVTSAYYRGADVAMIVYDCTNTASFDGLRTWLTNLREHADAGVRLVVVGNKCDLIDKKTVPMERGKRFAEANNALFFETSALTNAGIDICFMMAMENEVKLRNERGPPIEEEDDTIHLGVDSPARTACCK